MDKSYRTSVKRALTTLLSLDIQHEYTSTFAEDIVIDMQVEEIFKWIVDRDKRQRKQIIAMKKERYRNVAHLSN
jgi:hypothetical protein